MLKHYAEFLHPGIIVSENSNKEVKHRDPAKITVVWYKEDK